MGCLQSLASKIIFLALIVAFFHFGGYSFVRDKIMEYQNPPREEFIKTEKHFGDFSKVPVDYQLKRDSSLLGYKKTTAVYLPTGQKIAIFDMRNEYVIALNDFDTKEVDYKIKDVLGATRDSFMILDDIEVTQRGKMSAQNATIPYVTFKAKVRNIPFKEVIGTMGAYKNIERTSGEHHLKIILTIVDSSAYNPAILQNFIKGFRI